jgi:hypothetical protein
MNNQSGSFDIIGDIHGHAGLLEFLLQRMGYSMSDGIWRHPDRTAIFVGDFIDRGPSLPETLRIVRGMVVSGAARAVLGNHEWDALRFACDPGGHGELKTQLEQTHSQFKDRPDEWQDYLEWFRTLPLALDLGRLRVVHACWNQSAVDVLRNLPPVLDAQALASLDDPSSRLYRSANVLLNGLRLVLPGNLYVLTTKQMPMNWMRSKWWIPAAGCLYADLALPELDMCPFKPVELPPDDAAEPAGRFDGYPPEAPPVFFGHYSLPRDARPQPMTKNVACLDYSVWKGGDLVAYRWDGEQTLSAEKFVTSG